MNRRIRFLRNNYPEALTTPVLDVGCGPGIHLYDFARGSVGLDGRDIKARDGYRIVRWNFGEEVADVLAAAGEATQFKYIWCNDVLEHVLAPHEFLLNLRRVLADDGVLFLGVPLVNRLALRRWQTRTSFINYFCGFLSQDHVNFFTFRTLKYTTEYAGFSVDGWYSPFLPGKRPWMLGLEPVTQLALRKRRDFNYGPKAYKMLDDAGYLRWKQDLLGAAGEAKDGSKAPER